MKPVWPNITLEQRDVLVLFVFEEKLTSWAFGIFSSSVLAQAKRGSSICETVNFSNSCRTCAFNFMIEMVKWAQNSYFFRFGSFSFILLRHSAWNGSFISENGVDRWVPESEFIFGLKCRLNMSQLYDRFDRFFFKFLYRQTIYSPWAFGWQIWAL